jgi:hypothetical protein
MKKKFVNCGFEFTAEQKVNGEVTNNGLIDGFYSLDRRGFISPISWIQNLYEDDGHGCEIPTPIVTNQADVTRYFNEFKSFVDASNLTIDINEAKHGLGGCHIHMDVSKLRINKRKDFIRNMIVFITNNPQLNWGFNDVNDNDNANSLLCEEKESARYIFNGDFIFVRKPQIHHVTASVSFNDDENLKVDDNELIIKGSKYYKFARHTSPLRVFLFDPINVEPHKHFGIRYNNGYKTVELRIFDMPKNLTQHLLHHEVATAIYNYCLDKTNQGIKLKLKYKKFTDINQSKTTAIKEFKATMTLLGISNTRTKEQIENIHTRYQWQKQYFDGDKKNNYLL